MAARPNPTIRDMVLVVAILLIPVVLLYWFFARIPEPTVTRVDWAPIAAKAQEQSPYPIARPQNLPADWTAVRARWTVKGDPGLDQRPVIGNTWQLGFLTPERMYIGLDQRDDGAAGLIVDATREGVGEGTVTVAGRDWQRFVSRDGRTRSLVLSDPRSTVVVSGDLPYAALEAFAATLAF